MLSVKAPFPHSGSEALLGDARVRIISVAADGTRHVRGDRIDRRVDLADLADPSVPADTFEAWIAERRDDASDAPPSRRFTPAGRLFADFKHWNALRDVAPRDVIGPNSFNARLRDAGHASFHRVIGGPHGASHALCFDLLLKPRFSLEG